MRRFVAFFVVLSSAGYGSSGWPTSASTVVTATFTFGGSGQPNWCSGVRCPPTPTLNCVAAASGGNLVCTGGTPTKYGNPTTVSTPYCPDGFSGTCSSAVRYDGTEDRHEFGDTLDQTGDFSVCAVYVQRAAPGNYVIIMKAGQFEFADRGGAPTGGLHFLVYKTGGVATVYTLASDVFLGKQVVACASYDYVADGSSVIRGNFNGTIIPDNTTAVGPPPDVAESLSIAAHSNGVQWLFNGDISHVSLWSGRAFTAVELDNMVQSYMGHRGSGGESITVVRSTAESCAVKGTIYMVPPAAMCRAALSSTEYGAQVFGEATNVITYSDALDNAAWASIGTPTMVANDATLGQPTAYDDGVAAADRLGDDDATTAEGKRFTYATTTTGDYTCSCYLQQGTSASATIRIAVTGGAGTTSTEWTNLPTTLADLRDCKTSGCNGAGESASHSRRHVTATAGTGVTAVACEVYAGRLGTVADVGNIGVLGCQLETGSQPTPIIRTAGVAVLRGPVNVQVSSASGRLVDSMGQLCATVAFPTGWTGDYRYIIGFAASRSPLTAYAPAVISSWDGTNTTIAGQGTAFAGRAARFCCSWGPGGLHTKEIAGTSATTPYDGSILEGGTTMWLGSTNWDSHFRGYIRSVCLSRRPHGCEGP